MLRPHAQYEVLPDYWGSPCEAETEYNTAGFHMRNLPEVSSSHTYSFVSTSDPDASKTGWPSGHGKSRRTSSSKSWRVGARWAAAAASLSLMINLGAGIWVALRLGLNDGIARVYRGDCARVEKFNMWVHLAINALSTILLSGSNYCMQCLSAPSREDVNAAHAKGKWLDIGIPSIHNLRSISTKKVCLWWCLGLSSVPLHLMYNSAFFSSLTTNDYNIVYATEDFVTGAPFYNTPAIGGAWAPPGYDVAPVQEQIANYEKLDNAACIEAYAKDFITDRRTLVIIASNSSTEGGSLLGSDNYELGLPGTGWTPYNWICNDQYYLFDSNDYFYCFQVISTVIANAQNWKPDNFSALNCLSERVPGTCGLNINLIIILVVVVCNAGKLAGMLYVAFGALEDPLVTMGDAVSSFMASPDNTTKGMCLVNRREIVGASYYFGGIERLRAPKYWRPMSQRWFNAASKARWWTCILLFLTALGVIGGLLGLAVSSLSTPKSIQGLWSLGFGQVHGETLITGWALEGLTSETPAVTANVLIANLPQALLSFLYLTLNGLLTSMFLADEWSRFAKERKPLRVSSPAGLQRRTYFLQLPYRIALPLLVMSGLLHWLVSQSIFLAVVSQYDEVGNEKNRIAIATCGFSPMAMICVMAAGGCIIAFALALGFRKFPPEMPIAGSCSMAISAACHSAPGEGIIASTEALQWGVVPWMLSAGGAGHCCFSKDRVGLPIPGHMYAGVIEEKTGDLDRRK